MLEVLDDPDLEPPMDMQCPAKTIPVRISHRTGSHGQGDGLRNTHATNVGEYLWQAQPTFYYYTLVGVLGDPLGCHTVYPRTDGVPAGDPI